MKEAVRHLVQGEEEVEDLRQDTQERWARYEATGKTVSHEEVEAWLQTWGTSGRESPRFLKRLPEVVSDLVRLRHFISVHNPDAAQRAAKRIGEAAHKRLELTLIGRVSSLLTGCSSGICSLC